MFTNEYFKNGFGMWQEYSKAYTDLMTDAAQQTVDQYLALREDMGQAVTENIKKVQAMNAKDRGTALELANVYNMQAQAAAEQAAELFKTVSAMMTTTHLTDWAVERAAQMSAAAAADQKQ